MAKSVKRKREIEEDESSTNFKKADLKMTKKSNKSNLALPKSMIYTTKRLETLALDFVASNIDLLDSLVGLPELIGKLMFDHIAKYLNTQENVPYKKVVNLMSVFSEAYGGEVLEELTFLHILNDQEMHSRNLIINECSYFVTSFSELKKLDLSNCELGDGCPMLEYVAKMTSLECLNLSGNYLDKMSLMVLTSTIKYYGRGLTNLKVLDLSFNVSINYTCIDLISRFPSLEVLHLTGTTTDDAQFEALAKKMNFSIVKFDSKMNALNFHDFHVRQNKGWAGEFLTNYLQRTYAKKHPPKQNEPLVWSAPRSFYNKQSAKPFKAPTIIEQIKTASFYVILHRNNKSN